MNLTRKLILNESSAKRNKLGETKFVFSDLKTPHVDKIFDIISQETGIPKDDLIKNAHSQMAKYKEMETKSPILYNTIVANIGENVAFMMMEDQNVNVKGAPQFSNQVFMRLVRMIKIDHPKFFPLRNLMDYRSTRNEEWILIPSDDPEIEKKFGDIPTAAATANAQFIFNVKFMQHLLDFAHVKGIKAKGKKYVSNGGQIPDDYCYIEFLILHELYHFSEADFHYSKILKLSPKISNYVGDYRTNYQLVKNGYEQLPIGLFSDFINYDRQHSYREMADLIKQELDKLSDKERSDIEEVLEGIGGGKHPEGEGGEPGRKGRGGQGDPGDEDEDDGDEEGDSKGKGKGKDKEKGKGKPSDDGEPVLDEHGDPVSEEDLEKNSKRVRDELNGREDKDGSELGEQAKKRGERDKESNAKPGSARGAGNEFDWKNVHPTLTWKQILSKMFANAASKTEETYTKVNRRDVGSSVTAVALGSKAVRPGEEPGVANFKLGVVVDSSGSMQHALPGAYANLNTLFKRHQNVDQEFYLSKFSAGAQLYYVNMKSRKGGVASEVGDRPKGNISADKLFSEAESGGTVFSGKIIKHIEEMISKDYNIVIFSDTDIVYGENLTNLISLYKKSNRVFLIADSHDSYVHIVKAVGHGSNRITHM